jgi:predicted ABC-type transport system involved in lysophospholipase L1 biosynthesis ATPase subunit
MATLLRISRDGGTTLVLVTHNIALAGVAQQVVQIADGVIAP